MFEKVGPETKTLTEFYSLGQTQWCSDLQQREELEAAVGVPLIDQKMPGAIDERDNQWKRWLSELPVDERWILERHSGLWEGTTGGPPTLSQVARQLHIRVGTCEALWQAAIARLKEVVTH